MDIFILVIFEHKYSLVLCTVKELRQYVIKLICESSRQAQGINSRIDKNRNLKRVNFVDAWKRIECLLLNRPTSLFSRKPSSHYYSTLEHQTKALILVHSS